MAINIIANNIIMFFAFFPCGVWDEAQQRYASTVIPKTQRGIIISVKSVNSVPNYVKLVPN